ncbi:MAG: hypothetical protein J6D53_06190 [Blautia sp.]|nr:hypothetical protein [Blautia sp.]
MDEMNQNELAVFAYACQIILQAGLYEELNNLLEFAKNKGVLISAPKSEYPDK